MKAKVLAHVLRVNRILKARHLCLDCEEGWWLGLGIDSKWDWMTMVREPHE